MRRPHLALLILFLGAAVLLTGCSVPFVGGKDEPKDPGPATGPTIEGPGWSVHAPRDWNLDAAARTATAPRRVDDVAGSVQVLTTDVGSRLTPRQLEVYLRRVMSRLEESMPRARVVDQTALDGAPALAFGGTVTAERSTYYSRQVLTSRGHRLYTLTFQLPDTMDGRERDVLIDAVTRTWTWTTPAPRSPGRSPTR